MGDFVIRGATIVDGTGAPPIVGDVGVRGGRIAFVGEGDTSGLETLDGSGLMLAPGFVDPHTHYDAQLGWDPTASPSIKSLLRLRDTETTIF